MLSATRHVIQNNEKNLSHNQPGKNRLNEKSEGYSTVKSAYEHACAWVRLKQHDIYFISQVSLETEHMEWLYIL